MSYKVKIINNVNVSQYLEQVDNNKFWMYAAYQWWLLISPFVPRQTGGLMTTVNVRTNRDLSNSEIENIFKSHGDIKAVKNGATITYNAPYALSMYNGEGLNFRKDKNPFATAKWDIKAIPSQSDKLIAALQEYNKLLCNNKGVIK